MKIIIPTCEGNEIIVEADGRTSLKITPPEGIKKQEEETQDNVDNVLK